MAATVRTRRVLRGRAADRSEPGAAPQRGGAEDLKDRKAADPPCKPSGGTTVGQGLHRTAQGAFTPTRRIEDGNEHDEAGEHGTGPPEPGEDAANPVGRRNDLRLRCAARTSPGRIPKDVPDPEWRKTPARTPIPVRVDGSRCPHMPDPPTRAVSLTGPPGDGAACVPRAHNRTTGTSPPFGASAAPNAGRSPRGI